jgi:hypothetical protein
MHVLFTGNVRMIHFLRVLITKYGVIHEKFT